MSAQEAGGRLHAATASLASSKNFSGDTARLLWYLKRLGSL